MGSETSRGSCCRWNAVIWYFENCCELVRSDFFFFYCSLMARGNGQLLNLLWFSVWSFFPGIFFSVVTLDEIRRGIMKALTQFFSILNFSIPVGRL